MSDGFWDFHADIDPLREDLISMIKARYSATPRHIQVELGPSDVGHPCMRKMAFGITEVPRCNPEYDPLPSIIGTATHAWLDSAAQLANERLGRVRWMTETEVEVAPGLTGHCDLYDLDTGSVLDWKVLGATSFDANGKDPSIVYKRQGHMYGRGFENIGLPVKTIGIAMLPRSGTLRGMKLWTEDYNPALVDETLATRETVIGLLDDLRPEENPERYQWIPATPYQCTYCPFFKPNPTSPLQCNGKADS